jgi:hypothetical protein
LIAAFGKVFAESTSDLSGGSGNEDLHGKNLATVTRGELEKTDPTWQSSCTHSE